MSQSNQVNIENLLLKVFLYKYTPPFVPGSVQTKALSTFDPFSTTLDDTKYFTKYDISSFVVGYTFEQNIDDTTYTWSLELQDLALSYGTIDTKLKVPAPQGGKSTGLAFSNSSTESFINLTEYETNANNFAANSGLDSTILNAKESRGKTPAPLTVQNVNNSLILSTVPGLRLSDLIQEFDFVSVYLYKNTTPLDQVTGTFTLDDTLSNNPLWVFTPSDTGSQVPQDPYLQYETVLSTVMANGQPLFSNEINGFVMRKSTVSAINQVDRVTLHGNGWSRLFGSTRRVVKPSLFQGSLYEQGQLTNTAELSSFQTVFAGRPISYIIKDLFDLVFRVDFNTGVTSTSFITLLDSFYNISSLIVGNSYPANLFNLPQYLLSSVMKRRGFAYIEPINYGPFVTSSRASLSSQFGVAAEISPENFQTAIQGMSGQEIFYAGKNPVVVTSDVQNLTAYFEFLAEVYKNFSPDLKTPYEILAEIRNLTFVEIYEQPNGQFIVRSPQYNNVNLSVPGRPDIAMVRSSNLNIVSSSYSSTVENVISKLFTGYSANLLPTIPGLEQFAYCDGKLLDQFGLIESSTVANPNVNLQKSTNENVNQNKSNGLFEYASYMMQILNARLKTGTISCDLDNSIQVGDTFIDEARFKFGYIIGVNKAVQVSGTATMSLNLSYVRDAMIDYTSLSPDSTANNTTNLTGINVTVDPLPVLTDIENAFSGS